MNPPVLFLVGPTASGKSSLAIKLAKVFDGEIISADSMQVYRQMNIGTAKPSLRERAGIPHHLLDEIEIHQKFSVYKFRKRALQKIREIHRKGRLPIIVGGTGLYVRSLLEGLDELPAAREKFRISLSQKISKKGPAYYYRQLQRRDFQRASKINSADVRRIVRAFEILEAKRQGAKKKALSDLGLNPVVFGICRPRPVLYAAIESRVDRMIQKGLVSEVKGLCRKGFSQTACQAVGYKEILQSIKGAIPLEDAIRLIKRNTRRLAKRQMTWFRREKGIEWFERLEHESPHHFFMRFRRRLKEVLNSDGT